MFNKIRFYFFLFLILPIVSFAGEFKVVRVYDGDTFKAIGHDTEIKVRLVGIDAPETKKGKRESGQPFSQESKKYLAGMVLNKTVEIKGYGTDQYNRQLAVIFVDGKNVNLPKKFETIRNIHCICDEGKIFQQMQRGVYL